MCQLSHSFNDGTLCRLSWSTVESLCASCLTHSMMGHCVGCPGLQWSHCGPAVSLIQRWDIVQDVLVYRGVSVGQLSHPSRTRHDEIAESVPLLGLLGSHSGPHSPSHPLQDGALWRMLRHSVFQTRAVLTVNDGLAVAFKRSVLQCGHTRTK